MVENARELFNKGDVVGVVDKFTGEVEAGLFSRNGYNGTVFVFDGQVISDVSINLLMCPLPGFEDILRRPVIEKGEKTREKLTTNLDNYSLASHWFR